VLGLVHPPKGASDPVTAAIGSTAWTAIPRISIILGLDPNDETRSRRVVQMGKTNYAEPENGFAFSIANDATYECGYVMGMKPSSVSAEDIMAAPTSDSEKGERSEAREFLKQLLVNGSVDAQTVKTEADRVGISNATLKRARIDLGVISKASHDPVTGKMTGWKLSLPDASGPVVQPPSHLQDREPLEPLVTTRDFELSFSPVAHESGSEPVA
jgi:hypothetical protein